MGQPDSRPYRQGDHICALYGTSEEQAAVAAHYIADGLRHRERCLFAADDAPALERFRAALAGEGIDVADAEARTALIVLSKEEAHLVDGRFDCERILRTLSAGVEAALNDGFARFRACGDVSWLLDHAPGSEDLVTYEALLNEFFRSAHGLGMCQYDRRRLPAGLLDHAIAMHSTIVVDGLHKENPHYHAPLGADTLASAAGVHARIADLRRL